jgi:ribA/ribD-fused uncharacterized protein
MESIEFNSNSVEYAEFSNFYEAEFELDGMRWKTVEHYFQYQKFPGDQVLQDKIYKAKRPAEAKRLGKTRSPAFRTDWNTVRDSVMKRAVEAKFEQNPDLMKVLKNTGDAELIEKSHSDAYWGSGRTGKGQNRMGKVLMEVRLKALM